MKHFALFLYNGWGIVSSPDECASLSKTVKDDLLSAGFVSNGDKSVWEPCQSIFSLGIFWHNDSGAIEISERRVAKIVSTVLLCHRLRVCYFCEMPSLFYGANNFYWSCGGEYKSYYDATLPYVFRLCTLLGCLFRTRSIHKGRNYFLEGEY